MKNLTLLIFALVFVFATTANAETSSYYIDDSAVEEAFSSGISVIDAEFLIAQLNGQAPDATVADANPWVAFALAWVVGFLGIHRVYLGGGAKHILLYIITCGGLFGVVTLVDWIVLLIGAIEEDISKYVGNEKFIMWA